MKTFAEKKQDQTERKTTYPASPVPAVDRQTQETMRALLDSGSIGAKLKVGAADDPAEYEADRMADAVVNGNAVSTQLQSFRAPVAAKARSAETASFLSDAKGGAGRSLTTSEANYFESRFNSDFTHLRIHDSLKASQAASSINARAFTHGSDIYLNRGEYSFNNQSGKRLMAHELAHTLQGNCHGRVCRSPVDDAPTRYRKKRPKRFANEKEIEVLLGCLSAPELVDMGVIEQSMFAQALSIYSDFIQVAEIGFTALEYAFGASKLAVGPVAGAMATFTGAIGIVLTTIGMAWDFIRASGTDKDILRILAFVESLVNIANNKPLPEIHDYQLSFGDREDKKTAWQEGVGGYKKFMAKKPKEAKIFLLYIAMSDPDWVRQELFELLAKAGLDKRVYAIVVNKKLSELALEAMSVHEEM